MDDPRDPVGAPGEEVAYAEHRAALDATLFAPDAPIVFELCEGELRERG